MLMEADLKKQHTTLKSFFTNDKQRYTFYFDLAPNTPPTKIDIYLQARTLTEDALLFAIQQLNQVISKDNIELVTDVRLYKARLVGRNFKPKTDLPCLSLYQKICDLKIEQIAVQIPNREKAIRQIKQQIQISKESTLPIEIHKQNIQEDNKKTPQSIIVDVLQVPKEPIKQNIQKLQGVKVQQIKQESKADKQISDQNTVNNENRQQAKKILPQTKEQRRKAIEQIPMTNDQSDELREPSQQIKVKRQQQSSIISQEKDTKVEVQHTVENIQIQRIQEQSSMITQAPSKAQDSATKLLRQLIQERKELQRLRREIAEQKKDIREQRQDLRQQRSEVRQMRKQIGQQRVRLQQQRKQLCNLLVKMQEQRREWQEKKSTNRKN